MQDIMPHVLPLNPSEAAFYRASYQAILVGGHPVELRPTSYSASKGCQYYDNARIIQGQRGVLVWGVAMRLQDTAGCLQ